MLVQQEKKQIASQIPSTFKCPIPSNKLTICVTAKKHKKKRQIFLHRSIMSNCTFFFRNHAFLNERIIDNPNTDETISTTICQYNKLLSIECKQNYLKLNFGKKINMCLPPIQYVIDRFINKCDAKYKYIAQCMLFIENFETTMMELLGNYDFNNISTQLESIKDENYVVYYFPLQNGQYTFKNILFSNNLLDMLGFSPEDICLNSSRLDNINIEFVDNNIYYDLLINQLHFMNGYNVLIKNNEVCEENIKKLKDSLTLYFHCQILNSNYEYCYCSASFSLLSPTLVCLIIHKVQAIVPFLNYNMSNKHIQLNTHKNQMEQKAVNSINEFNKTGCLRAQYKQFKSEKDNQVNTDDTSVIIKQEKK